MSNQAPALSYQQAQRLASQKGWRLLIPKSGSKVTFVSPDGKRFPASKIRGNVPLALAKALTA